MKPLLYSLLAAAELRPGTDESRVKADKATAATQLALATEAVENLQQFLVFSAG